MYGLNEISKLVSIHAWARTAMSLPKTKPTKFQSTPPHGRARLRHPETLRKAGFNPRIRMGANPSGRLGFLRRKPFQSTRTGAKLKHLNAWIVALFVSIHAPCRRMSYPSQVHPEKTNLNPHTRTSAKSGGGGGVFIVAFQSTRPAWARSSGASCK